MGRDTYNIISKINLKCFIVNDMSKMRKFKMVTIVLYGKNKLSYIHSQTSSDGLNLSTVHPLT